jgi:hypothetical protein
MNRKLALAASVSASTVLVAGAVMVGALLSQGPERLPAPDLAAPAAETDSSVTSVDPIVVYEDQYEFVAAEGGPAAAAVATGDPGGSEAGPSVPASTAVAAAAPSPVAPVAAPSTTAAPAPATTTTTRPRGVPKDWPADKPIPPMPANCRDPQLEDNGVWNCQD